MANEFLARCVCLPAICNLHTFFDLIRSLVGIQKLSLSLFFLELKFLKVTVLMKSSQLNGHEFQHGLYFLTKSLSERYKYIYVKSIVFTKGVFQF